MAVYGAGKYIVVVEWKNGTKDKHRFGSVEARDHFYDIATSKSIKKMTKKN